MVASPAQSVHYVSGESQRSVKAAELMRNRTEILQIVTQPYYWLSGPQSVGRPKFWGCTCSSSLLLLTGHIYLHLEYSLFHPPPVEPAPH